MFLALAPKERDLHCFSLPTVSQAKPDGCTKLLEVCRAWVRGTWLYLRNMPATEVCFVPGRVLIPFQRCSEAEGTAESWTSAIHSSFAPWGSPKPWGTRGSGELEAVRGQRLHEDGYNPPQWAKPDYWGERKQRFEMLLSNQ